MKHKLIYVTNQSINGLVYLKDVKPYIYPNGKKERKAKFRCYCGEEFETLMSSVKNKNTTSCGCRHIKGLKERVTTHGLSVHPLYPIWRGIKTRCYNSNRKSYKYYGGKGIVMCDEWLNNPEKFIKWGVNNGYKKGLQIDRVDNNGNYEPTNCRFVTNSENIRNCSATKLSQKSVYEIRNIRLLIPEITLEELGGAYNVHSTTIRRILNNTIWRNL